MLPCALVLLLGSAAAGASLDSPAPGAGLLDSPASGARLRSRRDSPTTPHPSLPRPAPGDDPRGRPADPRGRPTDSPPADASSTEHSNVNPNNIFGRNCAEGFVLFNDECVRTEAADKRDSQPSEPPLTDDDFFRSLGFFPDEPMFDTGSTAPVAVEPAPRTAGPDPAAVGVGDSPSEVRQHVNSLSDGEFLRELLSGDVERRASPDPSREPQATSPAPAPPCAWSRRGVVLIAVGCVFLVMAVLLAVMLAVWWRRRSVSAVTV